MLLSFLYPSTQIVSFLLHLAEKIWKRRSFRQAGLAVLSLFFLVPLATCEAGFSRVSICYGVKKQKVELKENSTERNHSEMSIARLSSQ